MACKYYIGDKVLTKDEFLGYVKGMPLKEFETITGQGIGAVPEAPFITETPKWVSLALKVALKQAVKEGASSISYTTGEQQNERYDLSKQVDKIYYKANPDGTYKVSAMVKGVGNPLGDAVTKEKLAEIVGKDVATKIVNGEGKTENLGANNEPVNNWNSLEGIDLKVGGKGMIGFYGSPKEGKLGIVGEIAESLWGKGSVKTTEIEQGEIDENIYDLTKQNVLGFRTDRYNFYDGLGKSITRDDAYNRILQGEKDLTAVKKTNRSTQHSIDITDKMRAEVEKGLPLYQKPNTLKWAEDRRINQKSFEILFDKLRSQFEGLNFIKENDSSLWEKGVSPSIRGYIDSMGIHYNLDRITTSTAVHEMQHIWNRVYAMRNPEKYAEFEKFVSDAVQSGKNDISRLSDEIKNKYPELNNQQHLDELMATMGGFTSIEATRRYLEENHSNISETDQSFPERIYDGVKRFVGDLWNGLKSILGLSDGFKIDNPDLEQFYKDFTNQIFHGEQFKFSPDELRVINEMGKAEQRAEKQPVTELSDITLQLASQYADSLKFSKMTKEEVTEDIFKQVKANRKGNEYYYQNGSEYHPFPVDIFNTDEKIKAEIDRRITPKYPMIDEKLPPMLQKYIQYGSSAIGQEATRIGRQKTAIDIANDFGLEAYSPRVIEHLASLLGLDQGAIDAVRYSQLSEHTDKRISGLYKDGMEGYDPIVVIHGFDANGRPDVSLFDVTRYGQGADAVIGKQTNILGDLMNDKEYRQKGGPDGWNDRLYSYRKLLLGMQALGMDATFRRLSVIQVTKDVIKPYQINRIADVQKILDILKSNPAFMDTVGHTTIRGIIENKRINETELRTPFLERMNNYIKQVEEATSLDPESIGAMSIAAKKDVFLSPTSKQTKIKALKQWQRDLQQEIKNADEIQSDPVYQLVSSTLNELKHSTTGAGVIESVYDLHEIQGGASKLLNTAGLQQSWQIQSVSEAMSRSMEMTIDRYEEYHGRVKTLLQKVANKWQSIHLGDAVKSLGKDAGDLFYDHLFKTVESVAGQDLEYMGKKYAKGDKVMVRSSILHIDKNDPETRALYDRKKLTDADLELNNAMLTEMKQRAIDNIYWDHLLNESESRTNDMPQKEFTRSDAERQFNNMYSRTTNGHVPTIEKSANELITTGKIGAGLEKYFETAKRSNEMFTDMVSSKGLTKLFESFNKQMIDPMQTWQKMGLAVVDDGNSSHLELFDPIANEKASHNLERIGNYFMLKGIRDEVISKDFLPEYNTQMALLTAWEMANDQKLPLTRDFLSQYFNRYVNRENADSQVKGGTITIPGGTAIEVSSLSRMITQALSSILLFGRIVTGVKVGFGGEFRATLNAIANSMANLGISKEMQDNFLPTITDHISAFGKLLTNPRKVLAVARLYHYWNETEQAEIHSPMKNVTLQKNIFSRGLGLITETVVDQALRIHSLISILIHSGAWKAYDYDRTTGEATYDPKKDKSYFNSDGTQSEEQKTLYGSLIERLKDQGVMQPEETVATRGADWDIVTNNYKWYANQFVYVGIDDAAKNMLTNTFYGQMVGMFRNFWAPTLYNIGLGGKTQATRFGSKYVAVKGEDGTMSTQLERRMSEGQIQSYRHILEDLMEFKDIKDPLKYWQNMPVARRTNLMRSLLYAGALATFAFFISKLSKSDEQRFSYYYGELMLGYASEEWMKNPIPILGTTLNLTQIALGQKNFNALLSMPGPVGGVRRVIKTIGTVK